MKKNVLLFVILITQTFSYATIINVDNKPNRPSGYYSSLQLAVNYASAGDSIYLYASNVSYGTITVDKELHFFGEGYSINGPNSYIYRLYLDTSSTNNTNPTGSSFQGLQLGRVNVNKPNIANILFAGNYLSSIISLGTNCPGWIFINNYIASYISLNYNPSVLISNNIMNSTIYSSNASSVIISHNIFFNFNYYQDVTNALIKDNIFMCYNVTNSSYMYGNTFYNNLSWRSALNPYPLPPESNSGSGNFSNQEPVFETATSSSSFVAGKDYHLKSTSPGKNGASDGTDIGPYGGNSPFVWGGSFGIPRITEANITNPVINQSTPVNVKVKAKSADL